MSVKRYVKKPVVIEAAQLVSGNAGAIDKWMRAHGFTGFEWASNSLKIRTLEGVMTAERNDFIIRGIKGEFYPCKPDIFAATYDLAEAE